MSLLTKTYLPANAWTEHNHSVSTRHHHQVKKLRPREQRQVEHWRRSPTAATTTTVIGELLQFLWHWLVGLLENVHKVIGMLELIRGEEGVRGSSSPSTTCAPNSVDVVLDRSRKVVVDDIFDVLHINASRCNICCN